MFEPIGLPEKHEAFFLDPRSDGDFITEFYPRDAGGTETDGNDDGDLDGIKNMFLAVYGRLNQCYAGLSELDDCNPEKDALLGKVSALIDARDALEDACAPFGFIAEPGFSGLLAGEMTFTHAPTAGRREEPEGSSFSLYVPIDPDIDPDELEKLLTEALRNV